MADPEKGAAATDAAATPPVTSESGDGFALVRDVRVRLTVEVGATQMAVGDVLALDPGAVVELDRNVGAPADVLINGKKIGTAEVTVEDERLAIRLLELNPKPENASS